MQNLSRRPTDRLRGGRSMETKDYFSPIFTLSHIDILFYKNYDLEENKQQQQTYFAVTQKPCKKRFSRCFRKLNHGQVWVCTSTLSLKTSAHLNEKIDFCNFASTFASLKGSVHQPSNPPCWTFAKSDFPPL